MSLADSFIGRVQAARPTPSGTQLPGLPAGSLPASAALPRSGPVPLPKSAPPLDLPPELANHPKFRILKELGRGGMGVVYKAEHSIMEKAVALKVITKSLVAHPEALERFHREVRAAAKLDHPHIVRALDADCAGDLHLLVMEFVEGVSLFQAVQKKGPLPIPHACHYLRQAALGLQFAHEQGMVHRDIKPHNLMLTPRGQVKILDFGLARLASEQKKRGGLTRIGDFMGTPDYVAPEQAMDASRADIRADLYSLGCTLYFLLAAHPPFQGDTAVELVLAHIEKEAKPLEQVRPDVPPELAAVVARLLVKDPAQRFQTPIEVAQALAPFAKAGNVVRVPDAAPTPPAVESASPGTSQDCDTSRVKGLGQGALKLPAAEDSPFGDLLDSPAVSPTPKKANKERTSVARWKKPPVLASAGVAVLVLAVGAWLLAGVILKVKVKTPDSEGVIVVKVDRPGAEVLVDGANVAVTWDDGGKKAEIRVKPGTYKVEVKKDGLTVCGEQVKIEDGGRTIVTAKLDKTPPSVPRPAAVAAADSAAKEPVAADQSRQLWVQEHGYFIRGLGNDWFEKWEDGEKPANLFSETQRTKEFVELHHRQLPVTFRLYKDKALFKDDQNAAGFVQSYEGKWQSIPK